MSSKSINRIVDAGDAQTTQDVRLPDDVERVLLELWEGQIGQVVLLLLVYGRRRRLLLLLLLQVLRLLPGRERQRVRARQLHALQRMHCTAVFGSRQRTRSAAFSLEAVDAWWCSERRALLIDVRLTYSSRLM